MRSPAMPFPVVPGDRRRPPGRRRLALGLTLALGLASGLVWGGAPAVAQDGADAGAADGSAEATAPDAPPVLAPLSWPLPPAALATEPAKRLFGAAPAPAMGKREAVGFYSNGCLAGGLPMASNGPGWQRVRLDRNRHWGTAALIHYLRRLAGDSRRLGRNGILIGDLSQPRGGPMLTGHASHQTGLDVDIWYDDMPAARLTKEMRETIPATSLLKPGTRDLDETKATDSLARLLRRAASDPTVERVFVNPAVKRWLCRWPYAGVGEERKWLRKIRPYWGHDDHFHVRLACPPGMASCHAQAPPPPGDGCGGQLDWWATDEPWDPAKQEPPKPPLLLADMPAACRALVEP